MTRKITGLILLLLITALPGARAAAQSTSFEPVSISVFGELGNARSGAPSVSADGRFVAFESDATNLVSGDANGQTDIFLHDRQSGETRLISISPRGEQGDGASTNPVLSGNGRMIVFESVATNLVSGDENDRQDIFVYDRITGLTERVSIGRLGEGADGASRRPDIDYDGRYLVYESEADNLVFNASDEGPDIVMYDSVTENVIRVATGERPVISGDGRYVAYVSQTGELRLFFRVLGTDTEIAANGSWPALSFTGAQVVYLRASDLFLFEGDTGVSRLLASGLDEEAGPAISDDAAAQLYRAGGEWVWSDPDRVRLSIWRGAADGGVDLSAGGQVFVLSSGEIDPSSAHSQVYVRELAPQPDSYHLAGRVTDSLGIPLALVTVSGNTGRRTRTDADGYFYLSGYPAGALRLTPEKEGYEFEPRSWNLSVFRDVAGYLFTASPEEKLLEEARKDIGMPYGFDRGCDGPNEGCGKRFHGFAAGYCTDLVLDAYTFGLKFDINYALQQDAYANPEHFYRWRDARNTHDMWRYFNFSGQMLDHSQDYLPGDIVFFDWVGDGEIDHVALVSEVANGRPVQMVDATGVIDQNPSGLAAELDWLGFHEATVRGHARWNGAYEPVRSGYPEGAAVLQTALSGGGVFLRIRDASGQAVSFGESALPGAVYFDLDWEEIVSVLGPAGRYFVEIRSVTGAPEPFILTVQTLSQGRITGRAVYSGSVQPGEVIHYAWAVDTGASGALSLRTDSRLRHARISGKLRKP